MSVTATCLIMCPSCKALFRTQRASCYQCGESLVEGEVLGTRADGRSWGEYGRKMQDEVRNAKRTPVTIEGNALYLDGVVGEPVTVEDLAKGGLKFRSDSPYNIGTRVRLLININSESLVASGIVRRVTRALGDGQTYMCGIEFLHTDPGLSAYIAKLG